MSENLRLYSAPAPATWSLVSFSGRDAKDFLQRLTTVDTRKLAAGRGTPGFFLEPKGRILAAFTLWRLDEYDYAFEFDAGAGGAWRDALINTIEKYHFGEDVTISEVSAQGHLACLWVLPPEEAPEGLAAVGPGITAAIEEEIRLFDHGDARFGRRWISAWGHPARLEQWAERALPGAHGISMETLECWRVENLGTSVDHEITPEVNPLEIGLRSGVAEQKGCYPGQEVLEKILALGAPARRLVRLEGAGPLPDSGTPLTNLATPPVEVGTVTSACLKSDGTAAALALVRKIHAKEGFEVRTERGFSARVKAVAPYESPSSAGTKA